MTNRIHIGAPFDATKLAKAIQKASYDAYNAESSRLLNDYTLTRVDDQEYSEARKKYQPLGTVPLLRKVCKIVNQTTPPEDPTELRAWKMLRLELEPLGGYRSSLSRRPPSLWEYSRACLLLKSETVDQPNLHGFYVAIEGLIRALVRLKVLVKYSVGNFYYSCWEPEHILRALDRLNLN